MAMQDKSDIGEVEVSGDDMAVVDDGPLNDDGGAARGRMGMGDGLGPNQNHRGLAITGAGAGISGGGGGGGDDVDVGPYDETF